MPVEFGQSLRILRTGQADLGLWGRRVYESDDALGSTWPGCPRVILEPNAYPGMANKASRLSPDASFSRSSRRLDSSIVLRSAWSGTPIRQAFLDGVHRAWRIQTRQHLLIFGGSQGAKALNAAVMEGLPDLMTQLPHLAVTHQTGESDHARVRRAYRRAEHRDTSRAVSVRHAGGASDRRIWSCREPAP